MVVTELVFRNVMSARELTSFVTDANVAAATVLLGAVIVLTWVALYTNGSAAANVVTARNNPTPIVINFLMLFVSSFLLELTALVAKN
jgi:hypothetical protein